MTNNDYVTDFLTYYCSLKYDPEYAVLINGNWGSGKTWFVEKFIDKFGGKKFLYISLYGLTTFAEIEDLFFEQLHPVLASKGMGIAAKIAKGFLKNTIKIDLDSDGSTDGSINSIIPDINIPDYFQKIGERILVFDDLGDAELLLKIFLAI